MKKERYLKAFIYSVVVVLLNVAGATLFLRTDLTQNKVYSLSEASIEAVENLSEPLTINLFFSEELPAPHNNTEKYLADLLEEYALHGGRYFNYRFYPIAGDDAPESKQNSELAQSYGIRPVNIQVVDNDEVKVKTAYMGLVMIHGDLMERLPAITQTEGLEYSLTMGMMKLGNKISALLALDGKIEADLYLSANLTQVAPFMGLANLDGFASRVEQAVKRVSRKSYDRLAFRRFSPKANDEKSALSAQNMMQLQWPDLRGKNGQVVPKGSGIIGMALRYKEKRVTIPILEVNRIPLFGTQYKLMDEKQIEEAVAGAVESLIDINEKVGYLSSHGTPKRFERNEQNPLNPGAKALNNFSSNLAKTFSVREVNLSEGSIPEDLNSLVIAGAKEDFSDHDLFQIDQALMNGKNVAIFIDAFQEIKNPNQQMAFMQPTIFTPVQTGLEKLLTHYGVKVKPAYIMDENCFKQNLPRRFGGGQQNVYFAPIIKNETINNALPFMKNIKGLVTLKAAPVLVDEEAAKEKGLTATTLFTSSKRSWLKEKNIALNPMFLKPPANEADFAPQPVAAMVEGAFTSYFADKPIPEKPAKEQDEAKEKENLAKDISQSGAVLKHGKPARLMVVGSVDMLTNSLFDEQGKSPNAAFVMNLMDGLNGRESIATMRSKTQRFNPIEKVPDNLKAPVKAFNIVGLPLLVSLFGGGVYLRRQARRKTISSVFEV